LLLKQEGAPMFSAELSSRECDGQALVALRGELDVLEAASVAAALVAVVARVPEIIIDLAGLEFIDSSGAAALVLARKEARRAGGDLLLVAPQEQVLQFLNVTGLIDAFPVLASAEQAAGRAGRSGRAAWPMS
jgi:anti-sigma B factor antagonist